MENIQEYSNHLAKAFTPFRKDEQANQRLNEYSDRIKREQEEVRKTQQAAKELNEFEKRKVNCHRETISLFRAKLFYTNDINERNGKPWYSLSDLDDKPESAYLALENYIKKNQFYNPIYSHAIFYMRDPDIPNGVPMGTYSDFDAFTIHIFYYYKNPTKRIQYLHSVQDRINDMIRLDKIEAAKFLESIYRRALYF